MRLWSVARFDFGLAEREFWEMTPRQFSALLKRWENARKFEAVQFALMRREIINWSARRMDGPPVTLEDLLPHDSVDSVKTRPKSKKPNRKAIAQACNSFFQSLARQ